MSDTPPPVKAGSLRVQAEESHTLPAAFTESVNREGRSRVVRNLHGGSLRSGVVGKSGVHYPVSESRKRRVAATVTAYGGPWSHSRRYEVSIFAELGHRVVRYEVRSGQAFVRCSNHDLSFEDGYGVPTVQVTVGDWQICPTCYGEFKVDATGEIRHPEGASGE